MDIQYNKLFPYPVLSPYTDDYIDCAFQGEVETKLDGYNLEIKANIINTNTELKNIIVEGVAEYILHVECPQTSFRDIVKSDNETIGLTIPASKVNGETNICIFITAKDKINNYSNSLFNIDYSGMSFEIDKGSILGMAKQYNLDVNKTQDDFSKIPSIFSILKLNDTTNRKVKVDMFSQKIQIWLPENQFLNYQKLTHRNTLLAATHSMIILPILQNVLYEIKLNGFAAYESYNWYKALTKTFEKLNIQFNDEYVSDMNPLDVSQMLIDMPIERGLSSLADIFEEEENDL